MAFQVGDRVGDYEVIAVLGAGGMGRVYKVRNVISERVEAMKVLLPNLANEPDLADRFIREIKVLASLNHPNIAALHTALRIENQLVMIMELVEGTTVEDLLKQGRIPLADGIEYICQVLSALSYAHAQGVIHRDIKPANMMRTPQGVIKLMDFGIAKSSVDRKLTMTGTTMGSLYYMSPEQVKGTGLDARSDLYSVGIALYEIATGARPFQGNSDYELMVAQLQQAPPPPIQVDPNLPPSVNEVILMALEKDPAKRFQTAEAFRNALESVRNSVASAVAPGPALAEASTWAGSAQPNVLPQAVPPPPSPVVESPVPLLAKPSSHRAIYMALGAILAITVIVVAATQLPRWLKTRAGGSTQTTQSLSAEATASTSTTLPQDASQSGSMVQGGEPSTQTAALASKTDLTLGQVEVPGQPSTAGSKPLSEQLKKMARPPAGSAVSHTAPGGSARQGASPKPAPPISSGQAVQIPESSVQASPSSVTPPVSQAKAAEGGQANAAALQELEEKMIHLSARAAAAKDSIENLRRQQQSQGLNLRSDISATLSRMEQYMNRADSGLASHDAETARKNMDSAEREIDKLEQYLGR
jgi:serine/threonine protein kinase